MEDTGEGQMVGDGRGLKVEDGGLSKQGEGKEAAVGAAVAVRVLVVLAMVGWDSPIS